MWCLKISDGLNIFPIAQTYKNLGFNTESESLLKDQFLLFSFIPEIQHYHLQFIHFYSLIYMLKKIFQ